MGVETCAVMGACWLVSSVLLSRLTPDA